MAATETRHARRTWPIVYARPTRPVRRYGVGFAWALFLVLGVPFALMSLLTMLARSGIYVDLFRPLWQPWPPDLLKPILGVAVFAATLAYLAYRLGHRSGFRRGSAAGIITARYLSESPYPELPSSTTASSEESPVPPPPPEDADFEL